MKVFVKNDKCIGCGSCIAFTNSEIFDYNDEGKAYALVEDIEEKDVKTVKNAIDFCPTQAIEEVDTANKENTEELIATSVQNTQEEK